MKHHLSTYLYMYKETITILVTASFEMTRETISVTMTKYYNFDIFIYYEAKHSQNEHVMQHQFKNNYHHFVSRT